MAIERTLSIIKPDATRRNLTGAIAARFEEGTIRRDFGESVEANSAHGSDAPETAAEEIAFFFRGIDIVG